MNNINVKTYTFPNPKEIARSKCKQMEISTWLFLTVAVVVLQTSTQEEGLILQQRQLQNLTVLLYEIKMLCIKNPIFL
jgi:hypothetical protein